MQNMINNSSSTNATSPTALTQPAAATPPPTVALAGKARVSVGFLTQNVDATLLVAIQRILVGMLHNPAYPSPDPTLPELTAARDAFFAAVNAAKDSRVAIVVRNQHRARLTALLRRLAYYVQVASGGDLPTLLGSGFTAQRSRQPVGALQAPANLRLSRGKASGQIIARCNKLYQAGGYGWRYANSATPTAWVDVDATFAASTTLAGLVRGTEYIVQARALGTAGPSDWSDSAMLMVV